LAVGQSLCSSILTLPHLLLQEDGKDLSVNTCHSVISIGVFKFNSNILSVGPLLPFEDFTSILVSPGQVTSPSQCESSGGATTLMPPDLRAFM
jgi:hypothetical protein